MIHAAAVRKSLEAPGVQYCISEWDEDPDTDWSVVDCGLCRHKKDVRVEVAARKAAARAAALAAPPPDWAMRRAEDAVAGRGVSGVTTISRVAKAIARAVEDARQEAASLTYGYCASAVLEQCGKDPPHHEAEE